MLKAAPSTEQAVHFQGLEAPVLLKNAGALLPLLKKALPTWPFSITDGPVATAPSMTITGRDDGTFLCQSEDPTRDGERWDPVNTVCEMIAALAWSQISSNPSWLCLHCAAVEFKGRLVLFPNRRRSGKSTLAAVLAQRGHTVFSDDFLPIKMGDDSTMLGVANGINPRLRLPVEKSFSDDFKRWVQCTTEVSNDQYAYLGIKSLAPRGAVLPIGAVVVLDRQDSACDAAFQSVTPMNVLDDLIIQNFGRMAHSGRILQASHGVALTARCHRLTYHSAEDAAKFLESQFQIWDASAARASGTPAPLGSIADLDFLETEPAPFDPNTAYRKAVGISEINLEDQVYVSDPRGIGIQKLNSGSSLIWSILDEPVYLSELTDLLSTAFPDHPRSEIASDCEKILKQFLQNHLIVPSNPKEDRTH